MKASIRAALEGIPIAGTFVYGSVARGTATATSDIDVFVLLEREIDATQTAALRLAFADLQQRLGFQPDHQYPVELFTIDAARRALTASAPDEDQREICQALTDTKIVIVPSAQLDELIFQAGGQR